MLDSRDVNTITGQASEIQAPSTSTLSYGHPPANHERIITAMEDSWNLIKMKRMTLAKSNIRKRVVGRDLERIKAVKLLPRDWTER